MKKTALELQKEQLDRLIDFYEQHKPGAGRTIEIRLTSEQLAKLLNAQPPAGAAGGTFTWPREQQYRGRTIRALL